MIPPGALAILAARTRQLLDSLGEPFTTLLNDWPAAPTAATRPSSAPTADPDLPVLRWLQPIAFAAGNFGGSLTADFCRLAPSLAWRQSYASSEIGAEFLRNYAWTELLGADVTGSATRLRCGFLLLGPRTRYPLHSHAAAELYVPLSGTACWLQGTGTWQERPPGSVIRHASREPHAMHTGTDALLAVYVWHGESLRDEARLS